MAAVLLGSLALSACSSLDSRDTIDLRQATIEYSRIGMEDPAEKEWWSSFGSGELSALLQMAQADSPDVTQSVARILRAEKELERARAGYFPTLSMDGGGTRRSVPFADDGMDRGGGSWQAGFRASYEVDLWGAVSSGVEAAEARREASRFDHDAATVSLFSDIANGYINLLSLKEQRRATLKHLELAREVADLTAVKVEYGVVSELENSRQQSVIAGLEARLADIERQIGAQNDALGQLTGGTAADLPEVSSELLDIAVPAPSFASTDQLVSQRPDVRAVEERLRAADADVEVARAALLPSLSLSAGAAASAETLRLLVDPVNLVLSVTGSLAQSVFDGGQRRIAVELGELEKMSLLEDYRGRLLVGIREVATALRDLQAQEEIERHRATALEASGRALDAARWQYRSGTIDYLGLLDAQREFIDSELQYISARQARIAAAVAVYRAAGGGGNL